MFHRVLFSLLICEIALSSPPTVLSSRSISKEPSHETYLQVYSCATRTDGALVLAAHRARGKPGQAWIEHGALICVDSTDNISWQQDFGPYRYEWIYPINGPGDTVFVTGTYFQGEQREENRFAFMMRLNANGEVIERSEFPMAAKFPWIVPGRNSAREPRALITYYYSAEAVEVTISGVQSIELTQYLHPRWDPRFWNSVSGGWYLVQLEPVNPRYPSDAPAEAEAQIVHLYSLDDRYQLCDSTVFRVDASDLHLEVIRETNNGNLFLAGPKVRVKYDSTEYDDLPAGMVYPESWRWIPDYGDSSLMFVACLNEHLDTLWTRDIALSFNNGSWNVRELFPADSGRTLAVITESRGAANISGRNPVVDLDFHLLCFDSTGHSVWQQSYGDGKRDVAGITVPKPGVIALILQTPHGEFPSEISITRLAWDGK